MILILSIVWAFISWGSLWEGTSLLTYTIFAPMGWSLILWLLIGAPIGLEVFFKFILPVIIAFILIYLLTKVPNLLKGNPKI